MTGLGAGWVTVKVPAIFWKWKLCRAGAWPKLPIFWNWTPKNIPDQQKRVSFQKSKKSAKSLHATVCTATSCPWSTRPQCRAVTKNRPAYCSKLAAESKKNKKFNLKLGGLNYRPPETNLDRINCLQQVYNTLKNATPATGAYRRECL